MTVPDPAPTVEDVLARTMCDALVETPLDEPCEGCKVQAVAVVAAIRAMTAEQQAQLIGGRVSSRQPCCRCNLPDAPNGEHGVILAARVVGPWRAEP